jgi:hypothetical protein
MRFAIIATLVAIGPHCRAHGQSMTDARQLTLAAPQAIVEVDTAKLKGQVSNLSWSPDGKDMYLQTVEKNRNGTVKSAKHYLVSLAQKSLKSGDQPPWVTQYTAWKSALASPAAPLFRIALEEREETKTATAAVGDLAKGGGAGGGDRGPIPGTSAEEVGAIANQSYKVHVWSLKLKGTVIGEWLNEGVVPGINWGWAPAPARLIAFTKRDGGPMTVMDEQGRKQEIAGPKNAILPAWSPDGSKIAWLEKKGGKTFDLMVADVMVQ